MTFADTVLTVSSFFPIPLDETIANTYFLVPFYCSRQPIHCLEISRNKNNLELLEAEIAKKLRTAQPQQKVTGSYKKTKRDRLVLLWLEGAKFYKQYISSHLIPLHCTLVVVCIF